MQNSYLIPSREVDLLPIAITGAGVVNINFTDNTKFNQNVPNASPLILLIKSDAAFYEGENTPDATKNVQREANVWHSIPVNGRASWNFLWAGSNVNILGKLLLGT